jgi:hypothetical protein
VNQAYRIAAIVFSALTMLMGYGCTRIRWAPRLDFDVIGVLWLLQNIAPLMLAATTLFFAGVAIYCWIQSAIAG